MKKIYLIIILGLIAFSPISVLASKFQEGLTATGAKVPELGAVQTLQSYAANLIQALLGLLGIVFVALLIYGGYYYLTSAGNEEKVKKGKNVLKAAVVGIVIVLSGYTLTTFIVNMIETPVVTNGPAPNCIPECVYQTTSGPTNSADVYNQLLCCNNRFDCQGGTVSAECCNLNDFKSAHATACAPYL